MIKELLLYFRLLATFLSLGSCPCASEQIGGRNIFFFFSHTGKGTSSGDAEFAGVDVVTVNLGAMPDLSGHEPDKSLTLTFPKHC